MKKATVIVCGEYVSSLSIFPSLSEFSKRGSPHWVRILYIIQCNIYKKKFDSDIRYNRANERIIVLFL